MNYVWEYSTPSEEQVAAASRLAKSLGISPVLGKLLLDRGISTTEEAKAFFRPQLTGLHDPFLFKDMDKAVARLNEALGRKERILVYGDYDVDGCTAVALVYRFLQQFYSNIDYYIPDRNEEGYGVSRKGVDYASETGVGLVIVLDCGIKAVDEIAYARDAPGCCHPECQARGRHLPLQASVWLRGGVQVHAGVCHEQRHRFLATPAAA